MVPYYRIVMSRAGNFDSQQCHQAMSSRLSVVDATEAFPAPQQAITTDLH
jgi:hypothetical protein